MKLKIKVLITTALLILFFNPLSYAKPNGMDRIKKAGVLTVGIKDDVPGFGYFNPSTKEYEGLEVDIAKAMAKFIFGDQSKVKFIPVTARNRTAYLNQDKLDMVIATFTVTDERKQYYDFSDIYYTDSVGLMVKKSSGITSLKNLENKKVGITQGSMTASTIKNAAIREGIFLSVVTYPSNQSLKEALNKDEIQAFCIDKAILHGYRDKGLTILPERFDEMKYAVAIKKDNSAVTKVANDVIHQLIKSGDLEEIMEKYGLE
ncbi:MAG: transporter substrate-binding domain-containing protein [Treponema sp.]|nr:transporter substrate-binding domain-containing protein [Treponema sp.]